MERFAEILAPVATWEMLHAAVHNGADAVYLGLPYFNARGRTPDYAAEEIGKMISFAHLYGVRVFLAANVLIFEREIEAVRETVREILPYHPDAFIVQDLGLVQIIKELAPDQIVHASTQMTVTNTEAIELTSDLGIDRYVLGREVSIAEIKKIRDTTTKELEVFVHGALCVSYSGQCLTSESNGGRSANRGQCAQSCRLPYGLLVDGKELPLGDKKHLVSPQDLCGLEDIDALVALGIDSFKIEGRYKSPEYVASTVKNYREARDASRAGKKLNNVSERLDELGLTFARGRFNGWFNGVNHQRLVDARYSRPQGNYLGEVVKKVRDGIEIRTQAQPTLGDGLVIYDLENEREIGGILFSVRPGSTPDTLWIRFDKDISLAHIREGMPVFHNSSAIVDKKLRSTFEDKAQFKKIAVDILVEGSIGTPLSVTYTDSDGNHVTATSSTPLTAAKNAPLSSESACDELGALSATPYYIRSCNFAVTDLVFVHTKELKELRRKATDNLNLLRTERTHRVAAAPALNVKSSVSLPKLEAPAKAGLSVLLRDESQVEALVGMTPSMVYLDFEFNKDYEKALNKVRSFGLPCGIATTRILKPGEVGHLTYINRLKPDAVLVRNLGALQFFQDKNIPLIGDFSLNVSNRITARYLLDKGLSRITPSYDLNQEQLLDLFTGATDNSHYEITVHQYMPAFHMEHCVFAAFLSNGTSYRDCGKPCEKHRVEMRDPNGVLHPLKADAECRNTMFQGKPQSAARLIPQLIQSGCMTFRLEALFEDSDLLRKKIERYHRVITGEAAPESLFTLLEITEQYGITEGQIFNEREYKNNKKYSSLNTRILE
jgi:putative protease